MRDVDCLSVRNSVLHIEGVNTLDLAERFGTPLFVFSEAQIRENLRRFREAFAQGWPGPVDVLPAMKANTLLATRQLLSNEGAGADIYSPEELAGVLKTRVDPERVSVNGGGKPKNHLRNCIDAGVRITVEDVHEIDLIQEVANTVLSFAYVTAVAFYLSLLSSFLLIYIGYGNSPGLERTLTTIIIVFIATTGFIRGLGGLEKLEAYSMSLQLSIVAALLIGIFVYDYNFIQSERSLIFDVQDRSWIIKACMLFGILLVVQGFETSRFLGEKYSAEIRVRTMRRAQLITGALYVVSVIALMPIVQHLNLANIQIAEIVSATGLAATVLPLMLIVAAIMSQFSAAVADTVGAGCLVSESSSGNLSTNKCYLVVSLFAIILIWTADTWKSSPSLHVLLHCITCCSV
jgi:hypothetical protein